MSWKLEYFSSIKNIWVKWGLTYPTLNDALIILKKAKREGYINLFRLTELKNKTDEVKQ